MTFRNPDATPVIPPQGFTFNPYTGGYDPVQDMRFGYLPRREQPQMQIQNPASVNPFTVRGRWIKNPEEVLPRDIPDDGSVALFPLSDFSQIIAKAWKSDGTIEEVRYIPEQTAKPEEAVDTNQRILEELAENRQALDQIMDMLTPKRTVRKEQ